MRTKGISPPHPHRKMVLSKLKIDPAIQVKSFGQPADEMEVACRGKNLECRLGGGDLHGIPLGVTAEAANRSRVNIRFDEDSV